MIRSLLRFHVLGAARVAQRNGLLLIGTTIVLIGMQAGAPLHLLRSIVLSLAARDSAPNAGLLLAVLAAVLAASGVPTVVAGLGGWIRSLPLGGEQHRRAATLALLVPMLPIAAFELLAVLLVPTAYDASLSVAKVVGLPLALLAAAILATPSSVVSRAFGGAALWLATLGRWEAVTASLLAIAAADFAAGPLTRAARRSRRASSSLATLDVRTALRAVGWPGLGALFPALVLTGFAHLYRVNNDYSRVEAAGVLRACALVGTTLLLAALADRLLVRRPAWPWARSLPVGSRRRVLSDAMLLGGAALVPVALAVGQDWRSALLVLAATPLLVLQASGAVRRGRGRLTRAGGEVLLAGVLVTVVVTAWPATALLCLAASPIALAAAERADRRLIVSAWVELHHGTVGDSLAVVT